MIFKKLEESGFEIKKIGEVTKTTTGGTPSRNIKDYFNGNIPWLKSGELNDGYIQTAKEHISEEALKNSNAKLFPKGTLLVALYGATVGKIGIMEIEAATNQAICAVFPKKEVMTEYLFWYFRMKRKDFLIQRYGGAQPNISQKIIRDSSIPVPSLKIQESVITFLNNLSSHEHLRRNGQNSKLPDLPPPLKEQKRIVARIESIITRIEEARRLRANAVEEIERILESYLRKLFSDGKFKTIALGKACRTTSGGTPSRSRPDYFEGNIPWLKSGELNDGLIINSEEHITEEALQNSNAKIFPKGTLLIALYGATVGKTGILGINSSTNQAICAVFPQNDILEKDYLHWVFKYKRNDFLRNSFGGAQPNISQRLLRKTLIPLPFLDVQHRIVVHLDSLQEKVDELRKLQDETKKEIEKLVPSILDRAFKGEI